MMNQRMGKKLSAVTAMVMAGSLLLSATAMGAYALDFGNGDTVDGIGKITSKTGSTVTSGLEYSNFTFTDQNDNAQTGYTLEFNPNTSDLVPYVYQPNMSWGSTVPKTVDKAKAEGLNVYGGVNGEFFSMNSKNYGTLNGIQITNGKVEADSEFRAKQTGAAVIAFDKDGKMQLTQSDTRYHLYVDGVGEILQSGGDPAIGTINKRYVGNNWWEPICYYDSGCGSKTDTIATAVGTEVVVKKLNNTELTVEGVLQGEVVSVTKNTYGSSFNPDEFVLYAQTTSALNGKLNALQPGQKVQIYVEEANANAREIMKNANSVISGTWPFVIDGKNNTAACPGDLSLTERAMRTGIGVKADGSYVIACTKGRNEDSNGVGMTISEFADMMIAMGCVTAVNLDGGGSSTMVAGDETVYNAGSRPVGNCVLVVSRPAVDATVSAALATEVTYAQGLKAADFPSKQWANIQTALTAALAVQKDQNAMTGEYTAALMNLRIATGQDENALEIFDYVSLKASSWGCITPADMNIANGANGELLLSNNNGKWPDARNNNVKISLSADKGKIDYDFTVAGSCNIILFFKGTTASTGNDSTSLSLSKYIVPGLSGDDLGAGNYKGTLNLAEMNIPSSYFEKDGTLLIGGVKIFAVGTAGSGSLVTVRQLDIADKSDAVVLRGDVNMDGDINMLDANMLFQYAAGKELTLTDAQKQAADITGRGAWDMTDALYLYQYAAGVRPEL